MAKHPTRNLFSLQRKKYIDGFSNIVQFYSPMKKPARFQIPNDAQLQKAFRISGGFIPTDKVDQKDINALAALLKVANYGTAKDRELNQKLNSNWYAESNCADLAEENINDTFRENGCDPQTAFSALREAQPDFLPYEE